MSGNWPAGVGRHVLDEVDSTNAEAVRRAPEIAGSTWILALRQTAGRGRRGRAWSDPPGNFAATYLTRIDEPPERAALRSFVAALALYDALVAVTGRAETFALKWPNDVLANGGKIAGILLETIGAPAMTHLAVGIGVNLAAAPATGAIEPGTAPATSLLSETGARVTPQELLDALAPANAAWEARLRDFGFQPVREAWMARAARLGQPITARTVREEVTGTFETVDEKGRLVLTTPQGRRVISAADVYF